MHGFWAKFALFVRELQNQLTNSRKDIRNRQLNSFMGITEKKIYPSILLFGNISILYKKFNYLPIEYYVL